MLFRSAIIWQCRRTSEYCDELKARGLTEKFRQKTGLIIDAYFSATKLKWILDNTMLSQQLSISSLSWVITRMVLPLRTSLFSLSAIWRIILPVKTAG